MWMTKNNSSNIFFGFFSFQSFYQFKSSFHFFIPSKSSARLWFSSIFHHNFAMPIWTQLNFLSLSKSFLYIQCLVFKSVYCTLSHYSKSQIFVIKFNFDKTLQLSREIKVVNNYLKSANPQHFHEFFTQNFFDNFSREVKVVNS